jgi:Holliday junction resolvase RusA-like endonuclease
VTVVKFTIHGEAASKANSRELVTRGGKPMFIKSKKALAFEAEALRQIPPKARLRLQGPVRVTLRMFYASERPDLDEAVVLDVLQDRYKSVPIPGQPDAKERVLVQHGVIRNDRQVREKHVYWALDRLMPRTEVLIEPLQPQQGALL